MESGFVKIEIGREYFDTKTKQINRIKVLTQEKSYNFVICRKIHPLVSIESQTKRKSSFALFRLIELICAD